MKAKYINIIILFIFFLKINTFSQILNNKIDTNYFNKKIINGTLKTNPTAILFGPMLFTNEYRFLYEIAMFRNQSIQIGISYLGKNLYMMALQKELNKNSTNKYKLIIRGYRFQFSYKYYFNDEYPINWYVGAHYSYSFAKITTKALNKYDDYISAIYTNYSFIAGYQLRAGHRFVFDFFGGFGYRENIYLAKENNNISILTLDNMYLLPNNLKLLLGTNIGIIF